MKGLVLVLAFVGLVLCGSVVAEDKVTVQRVEVSKDWIDSVFKGLDVDPEDFTRFVYSGEEGKRTLLAINDAAESWVLIEISVGTGEPPAVNPPVIKPLPGEDKEASPAQPAASKGAPPAQPAAKPCVCACCEDIRSRLAVLESKLMGVVGQRARTTVKPSRESIRQALVRLAASNR